MVRLREIPRTAAFAWSPGAGLPLIATGTRAGAVDADFSDETKLELWNLYLENPEQGVELSPVKSIKTDSRFHDIAWGRINNQHPWGVIAGALENGSLDLWDADALLKGSDDSFLSRTTKHSGAIKSLQFNPFKPELLATAGAKGEIFISDLNNVDNPFRLGGSAARADDFDALDWNKKVAHILATGSSGGFVTVWDVRAKKENLILNNFGRKAVSAIAWDPEQSTKLITAVPDDMNPLILVWDLRNSQAPEKTLKGHDQGVLSLSWCQQDSNLLLSCGKDNRTICWNPQTGQPYGDFPVVTNWTFQTSWNPRNPSMLATASFDGKIAVQTIQNTNSSAKESAGAQKQALDDEDFFNNAQTQPQGASFSLPVPPKWLERPVGVSFGFGGKVVSFGLVEPNARKSKIQISQFEVDASVGEATEGFEKALQEGNLAGFCDTQIAEAKTDEEKSDWKVIKALTLTDPKKELVSYLGFSSLKEEASGDAAIPLTDEDEEDLPSGEALKGNSGANKSNRLSSFFDKSGEDTFLSDLAATKEAKTNNPFKIYTGSETGPDKHITRALLTGSFESALETCLKKDRMSDAFMIAICGGPKCIEKAQTAYFNKKAEGPNYLRLLASIAGKNMWDVVHNADLKDWKETMAMICTYAKQSEFADLCEALGDRLEDGVELASQSSDLRKNASFCYLAGSKLEKVVSIWIQELKEIEESGVQDGTDDSAFSIHTKSLQDLIEKVTIFRQVTGFKDTERSQTSGWKLAPLYDKYTEYADVVAAHGKLDIAEKYLDLVPAQFPAAEVARNRVKQASRKAAPQTSSRQPTSASRAAQRGQPVAGGYQAPLPAVPAAPAAPAVSNPYAPQTINQPQNPYTSTNASPYTPAGYQAPQQAAAPPQPYGGYAQPSNPKTFGIPPPPRAGASSPSIPPPSKATNMTNWNDTPIVTKPPTSRRGTPSTGYGPAASGYPGHQGTPGPYSQIPPATAYSMPQRTTSPLPPPPKGSAPPRVSSPLVSSGYPPQQPERPPSTTATNAYAPPVPAIGHLSGNVPQIPRGPSPYNPPPSAPPPSNRYAPTPTQEYAPSAQPGPPPPQGRPSNAYAPPQAQQVGQQYPSNSYAPSAPPSQPRQLPPQGPPQAQAPVSRPGTAQSQLSNSTPTQPAPPPKHPAGDRSHISSTAQPIYHILDTELQRVSARAPPSFKPKVEDVAKRLNILFDHLNNDDLLQPGTVNSMLELSRAVESKDFDLASAIQVDIHTEKPEECRLWMAGVKRLLLMGKATP